MSTAFLAVDWGTTNRRVFLVDKGVVLRTERDRQGASVAQDYPAEIAAIRARFGDLPILMAGMVGSNIGWHAVPYVPAPAGFLDLAAALHRIDARTAIVPGISQLSPRADVMRGEEVQLLGAVAAGMTPADALLAQPGTHCKWVRLEGGRIASFTTAMNGELWAMLRAHSLLAPQIGSDARDGPAFRAGVAEGARRDLAASLFGVRAAGILGRLAPADAASFASGVVLGADVAARLAESPGATVHVLADPVLGGLYVAAIDALGGTGVLVDTHAAFVAGIARLWDLTQ